MSARDVSRDRGAWLDRIDWALVARGGSSGFTVLVLSGLLNPIVARANEKAGLVLLVVGAVAASVVAAWRARLAESPVMTGAAAALLSYTLVIPLIFISGQRPEPSALLIFAGLAVVVGAISGFVLARR